VRPQPRRTGTSSRSIGPPGKESRGPCQDLTLLTQHLLFTLELTQPLSLLGAEHVVALTTVGLLLAHSVRQRLRRAAQLRSERLRRPRTTAQQPHRLLTELRRIRRSRPWHLPLLSRAEPENITVSTRPAQFQFQHGFSVGVGFLGGGCIVQRFELEQAPLGGQEVAQLLGCEPLLLTADDGVGEDRDRDE
jgi:hypothetical protein